MSHSSGRSSGGTSQLRPRAECRAAYRDERAPTRTRAGRAPVGEAARRFIAVAVAARCSRRRSSALAAPGAEGPPIEREPSRAPAGVAAHSARPSPRIACERVVLAGCASAAQHARVAVYVKRPVATDPVRSRHRAASHGRAHARRRIRRRCELPSPARRARMRPTASSTSSRRRSATLRRSGTSSTSGPAAHGDAARPRPRTRDGVPRRQAPGRSANPRSLPACERSSSTGLQPLDRRAARWRSRAVMRALEVVGDGLEPHRMPGAGLEPACPKVTRF